MFGKLLVLIATLVGIVSFFLPSLRFTVTVQEQTQDLSLSGLQLVTGVQSAKDEAAGVLDSLGVNTAADNMKLHHALGDNIDSQLDAVTAYLLIPWVPTVLFLLFSLIGIRRFGRGLGALSMIVGIAAVGGWYFLGLVFEEANQQGAEAASQLAAAATATVGTEIGWTLVLAGGIGGAVGGLLGLIAPQPQR